MKENSPEFEEAFAYVQGPIRRRLNRFRDMPEHEDAIQEAFIWAWKALRDDWHLEARNGLDHVVYRAAMEAQGYLFDKRKHATGHPGMDKGATPKIQKQGEQTRAEISAYMKDYEKEHGTVPSSYQIAKALGKDPSGIRGHLRAMKEGRYTQIEWQTVPMVEEFGADGMEHAKIPTVDSFEDELLSEMTLVQELLDHLSERHVDMLYHLFWEGYTIGEWADRNGMKVGTAYSSKNKAMNQLRKVYQ